MTATWDETWMAVARTVAGRSSCERAQVGAVIVNPQQQICATGYNGPPSGSELLCARDCSRNLDGPTDIFGYSDCISTHAEMNALMFTDRSRRHAGTLYVTSNVCWACASALRNSGLRRVVAVVDADYRGWGSVSESLCSAGLEVVEWRD